MGSNQWPFVVYPKQYMMGSYCCLWRLIAFHFLHYTYRYSLLFFNYTPFFKCDIFYFCFIIFCFIIWFVVEFCCFWVVGSFLPNVLASNHGCRNIMLPVRQSLRQWIAFKKINTTKLNSKRIRYLSDISTFEERFFWNTFRTDMCRYYYLTKYIIQTTRYWRTFKVSSTLCFLQFQSPIN